MWSTPTLASIPISYHSGSKPRRRCSMAATSVLKIIRKFRLFGARYSVCQTPYQLCSRLFNVAVHCYFSFWWCFFQLFDHVSAREQYRVVAGRWWAVGGPWWALMSHGLIERIGKQRSYFTEMPRSRDTLIKNLSWRGVWYTEYLALIMWKFLIIFSTDVAAMGQRWRGFDLKWYEMGVEAKVGVKYVRYICIN